MSSRAGLVAHCCDLLSSWRARPADAGRRLRPPATAARRSSAREPTPADPSPPAAADRRDIDLSKPALKESTGYSWDRKTIEWEWTSCSGGRRMRLM